MTTARRKSNPVAPGVETARPDAGDHSPGESHLPPPTEVAPLCAPAPQNNLSLPRSPLIGRDHEIAVIQHLLLQDPVGLLTLTGPGGIGKTRMSLQVAANLLDHFVDGVYFVSLAPISDPSLVGAAIAQTLGLREAAGRSLPESLYGYLCDKQLLLVLDNFEQILAAAPLVGALLHECRRLKTLVTSRATLHLYGEQEFSVPSLALPDAKHLAALEKEPASRLTEYAALQLFCQRALAVKPDFALTPANAADVAKICLRLDGLPLAIELAAARIKLFSPSALLTHLQQRLPLLTGGPHDQPARQRTLRNDIAWSYDLLSAGEQTLFRRLAVFVGGFTLEAAQAVGDADGDLSIAVFNGVAALVNHSLLKRLEQSSSEPRFGMLETIREYGLEQLEANGEAAAIHCHHAEFFLALAEATEPDMLGARREQGLARLEIELDNLRTALAWSQTDVKKFALGLRLAGALTWFAHFGNHVKETHNWLVTMLQGTLEPTAVRAKALWGAGLMAVIQGDHEGAFAALKESETIWRQINDPLGLAVTLGVMCLVAYFQQQFKEAQRYGEESVALCRKVGSQWDLALGLENLAYALAAQGDQKTARAMFEEEAVLYQALGDTWGIAAAIVGLGCIAAQQGEHTTARAHLEKALMLRRAKADKWTLAESLNLLGEVLQRQGELEQAGKLYTEGLLLAREVGDKASIAHIFHHFGTIAQSQSQVERAVRLFAAAATLRSLIGGVGYHTLVEPADLEQAIDIVRRIVGEKVFATRWVEGQVLTLEQAIEYALAGLNAPQDTLSASEDNQVIPAPPTYPAELTAREVEVLRLLAQGLTYAQIADKLIITRRTVNGHVTSIYSKLGVNGRAAATRFAVGQRLV